MDRRWLRFEFGNDNPEHLLYSYVDSMADAALVALLEPSMTDFVKLSLNFSGDAEALTCQV